MKLSERAEQMSNRESHCYRELCVSPKETRFFAFFALFYILTPQHRTQWGSTLGCVVFFTSICARVWASVHACITRELAMTTIFVNACNMNSMTLLCNHKLQAQAQGTFVRGCSIQRDALNLL